MLPIDRLDSLKARFSEVEEMLCQPDVASDVKRMTLLNRERSDLAEVVEVYDDKKLGLTARVKKTGEVDDMAIESLFGKFTRPWVWAE